MTIQNCDSDVGVQKTHDLDRSAVHTVRTGVRMANSHSINRYDSWTGS
jgi:hypothetical protein